jgi:hypothetical protein
MKRLVGSVPSFSFLINWYISALTLAKKGTFLAEYGKNEKDTLRKLNAFSSVVKRSLHGVIYFADLATAKN